jgi:hypothetical protein
MEYINIVQNDEKYRIKFHITNDDEVSINLTNALVLFKARMDGFDTNCVSGECGSISAEQPLVSGYCYYEVQPGDFVSTGLYDAEIEIKYNTTGEEITVPNLRVLVQESLD